MSAIHVVHLESVLKTQKKLEIKCNTYLWHTNEITN